MSATVSVPPSAWAPPASAGPQRRLPIAVPVATAGLLGAALAAGSLKLIVLALVPMLLAALGADYATFTSASSVRFFHAAAGTLAGPRLASIGPITTAALEELGATPAVEATEHTPDGLVAALLEDVARGDGR